MSKLEKLDRSRKLLDEQGKQLEETRAKVIQQEITAIFDVLGISVKSNIRYLNHSSNNVTVSASFNDYNVNINKKGWQLSVKVKDEKSLELLKFKKVLDVINEVAG